MAQSTFCTVLRPADIVLSLDEVTEDVRFWLQLEDGILLGRAR